MVQIKLPSLFKEMLDVSEDLFSVEAKTVKEAIDLLCEKHNKLSPHIFNNNGKVKNHVILALNNKQTKPEVEVSDGDRIEILVAAAGGI